MADFTPSRRTDSAFDVDGLQILVLAKYYPPYRGGIEDSTQTFCESVASDARIHVIAFNHEPGYRIDIINGVVVERFPVHFVLKSQPVSLSYFWKALHRKADIVHFHAPNVLASLALVLRKRRPLVSIHHMDIFGRPFLRLVARYLYNAVLRRSTKLVVTSAKNVAISSDIRVDATISVIPLGIDPANYEVSPAVRAAGREWRTQLAQDAPLVGFLGRHARYKGLDVLVHAIAQLPGVHAVIAGDGPYGAEAKMVARELQITDRIHFVGPISHEDKLKLLSMIDVFAFPSTEVTEAFGLSQLEAMMLNVPVVSSALPTGVTDVAIDGETAVTVPPGDAAALSVAIARMLRDPELCASLTANARTALLAKFTVARMSANFQALNAHIIA